MLYSSLLVLSVGATIGTVDLIPARDLWAIEAKVDGRSVRLLVDTGNPSSYIFGDTEKEAKPSKLEVGGVTVDSCRFATMKTPAFEKEPGYRGVLGLDNLKQFALFFDFYMRKLVFAYNFEKAKLAQIYSERCEKFFPSVEQSRTNFSYDTNGYAVVRSSTGQNFALDTGSGALFAKREQDNRLRSLGKMTINLYNRSVHREFFLAANINLLNLDLSTLIEPETSELAPGINGAFPLNDLYAPLILLDLPGQTLSVPSLTAIQRRLVRLSKFINFKVTEQDGKLVVGPDFLSEDRKHVAKLIGHEIVAMGDTTGAEIIGWMKTLTLESLEKIDSLVRRRQRDMVLLLKSDTGIVRATLVGTSSSTLLPQDDLLRQLGPVPAQS